MRFCRSFIFILLLSILFQACERDDSIVDTKEFSLVLPIGFPQPNIPENNPLTEAKINLGKQLFFDNLLSKDSSVSCASCHAQVFAFGDEKSRSKGTQGRLGSRNAQALFNLAWSPDFFRDGGVSTLELSALAPLDNHDEMDLKINELLKRLNHSSKYKKLFRQAFNDTATVKGITFALASFQRILISGNSKYDASLNAKSNLSTEEELGKQLFFSERTSCSHCHSGFNFTNNQFENNGLFENVADLGRARVTGVATDIGKFKVPSLRNISFTSPFMHDGSFTTIDEVISHYNEGGKESPNKNPLIRPLFLTIEEMQAIKAFLLTLNDEKFINSSDFKP